MFGFHLTLKNILLIAYIVFQTFVSHPSFLLIAVINYILLVYSLRYLKRGSCEDRSLYAAAWMTVFAFASLLSTIGFILILNHIPAVGRYFLVPACLLVISAVLLMVHYFKKHGQIVSLLVTALFLGLMISHTYDVVTEYGVKLKHYTAEQACIDSTVSKYGLSHGIAQYWDARRLELFSAKKIRLAQYSVSNGRLSAMHWLTSGVNRDRETYDFLINGKELYQENLQFPIDKLTQMSGTPIAVKRCGHIMLYIYGKDRLRVEGKGFDDR